MPSETTLQIRTYTADFLVIGGGAAGCYAALAYCGCLDADGCHPGPDGHGLTAHEGAAAVADAADATAPAMSCTAPLARHNAATHDGSDVPAAPAVHDGAPATGADGGSMGVPARPWHHAPVLIAEKAHIRRSGCLAAGVNALNAYIAPGRTPQDYVDYARADAGGIVRGDLLLSMAQRLNQVTDRLEELGLAILKNEDGSYAIRGDRNLKINGENLKPLLHDGVAKEKRIETLNHVNVFEYIVLSGRVAGAYAFSVREPILYVLLARSVLCATGGAAGLYAPNHTGFSRHKMWYPPFNTGAGYAMGIRAGAEMTTLEMRFIALRCKDTIAPTGTLAQGIGARQVNRKGEIYEDRYERTTAGRLHGTVCENREGRGPCRLGTAGITPEQEEDLVKAYLNMAPSQSLRWLETDAGPGSADVEIEGTEPYIVGGHTASGYWVDTYRETTLPGLFAAGDAAGGCPQKYVTGAMAEGEIAAKRAAGKYGDAPIMTPSAGEIAEHKEYLENTLRPCGRGVAAHHPVEHPSDTTPCPSPLAKNQHTTSGSAPEGSYPQAGLDSAPGTTSTSGSAPEGSYPRAGLDSDPGTTSSSGSAPEGSYPQAGLDSAPGTTSFSRIDALEAEMQNVMDRYAGGIGSDYRYTERSLSIADTKIRKLEKAAKALTAADMQELSYVMELRERLTLCRFLIAHLAARKETRWRSFAEHLDHPGKSDAWLRYVNSSLGAEGKPRIIYRDLVKEDEVYIHG